jgi:ABC-type sulfate transport system permease component
MADRKGSSPGKEKREQSSDRPFFVALGILGGIYVFLIVAMLLADVAYLAMDRRVKIADIDFQLDDSGRLIQHGDRISNQYDRLGLTITSHSPDNPPTIFEYVPQVEGTEPARLLAPVLGIGPAEKLDPAAPGPTEYLPGSLVFQWADPVELTMVDLAHLPAAPGMTLTLLNAEGKTLQVRQFDEIESQASLTVQIGDTPSAGITNVLKLVIDMPRGGFVARVKYFWIGRQLAPWEKDHPFLSRLVYNPLTEALSKPEIRYSIKLSLISCTITAFISLWVAIPIGYLLSRYRFPGRNLIDATVDIPIVLPPLVVGLSLLILFQYLYLPFKWLTDLFSPANYVLFSPANSVVGLLTAWLLIAWLAWFVIRAMLVWKRHASFAPLRSKLPGILSVLVAIVVLVPLLERWLLLGSLCAWLAGCVTWAILAWKRHASLAPLRSKLPIIVLVTVQIVIMMLAELMSPGWYVVGSSRYGLLIAWLAGSVTWAILAWKRHASPAPHRSKLPIIVLAAVQIVFMGLAGLIGPGRDVGWLVQMLAVIAWSAGSVILVNRVWKPHPSFAPHRSKLPIILLVPAALVFVMPWLERGLLFDTIQSLLAFLCLMVSNFLRERVVYNIPGVILAQFMVAAAFAVRTMRVTFDQIDSRREQVALTLGCSRFQAFSQVVLPEARRGILTAGTLAWARALGEFGPLLIFAGATRMKTEVLSTTIFLEMNVGDIAAAVAVSLIMVTGAMIVLIIARVWGTRGSV